MYWYVQIITYESCVLCGFQSNPCLGSLAEGDVELNEVCSSDHVIDDEADANGKNRDCEKISCASSNLGN